MDVAELFSRDPRELSPADIRELVTRFRAARGQFVLGNAKAGNTKPLTAKQKANVELGTKLDLKLEL